MDFARSHGVTLIAAEGNENTDLGHPATDTTSPDFGAAAEDERTIDNASCLTEPTEAPGVIAVSAVGPPNRASSPFPRKSFYSNYGVEQTDVAAPGGDSREFFGTPQYIAAQNRVLAPYPLNVAQACRRSTPPACRRDDHLRRRTNRSACPRRSCATAPRASARSTSGCRARRWPPRTRSASRR